MSVKSPKIAALIAPCLGQKLDAHYLGYFHCFNSQLFFEAHEVLEERWLPQRHGPNGAFYKGLIQLAGAFVHIQKGRRGPAIALFKLARRNLEGYPACHESLEMAPVLSMIDQQIELLSRSSAQAELSISDPAPKLSLVNHETIGPSSSR